MRMPSSCLSSTARSRERRDTHRECVHKSPPGNCPGGLLWTHFSCKMLCAPHHTTCRFAGKNGFSARFRPEGAVPPPCVAPFAKVKKLQGLWIQNFKAISINKINTPYTLLVTVGADLPRIPDASPLKARWRGMRDLGGGAGAYRPGGKLSRPAAEAGRGHCQRKKEKTR